ncbi:MAG TPA: hypothetical protein VKV95_09910 [Terriglobia bacterium]|nr:hypothetical protein [Terriglobia bacterium]
MAKPSVEANAVFSHWHHPIENFSTSAQEFYGCVEAALKAHQLPDVEISRIEWKEGGTFSSQRLYLRVKRGSLVFDICAAPYGADYFFSWWLAEIPPRFGLLRLAAVAFASFLTFIFLTGTIGSVLGGVWGALLGLPLGIIALVGGMLAIGQAARNGVFGPGFEEALITTPILGWIYVKIFGPFTYYRMDTKLMFQSAVNSAVQSVVEAVTSARGIRAMTELERKPMLRELGGR